MGRQLADLRLRPGNPAPHDQPDSTLPNLKHPPGNSPERSLPPRIDFLALLLVLCLGMLASDRPHLPRAVCVCFQLLEGEAEAHADECVLLSGQGRDVLLAFDDY